MVIRSEGDGTAGGDVTARAAIPGTATVEAAPPAVLAQAQSTVDPYVASIGPLHEAVATATDAPARDAAVQALRERRVVSLRELRAAQKSARRAALQAAARDPAVQVARLAIQLARQQLGGGGRRHPGRRAVTQADFQAATADMRKEAADTATPQVERVGLLRAAVDTAVGAEAKAAARQALQYGRRDALGQLQASRAAARGRLDAAADHTQRQAAKQKLVLARLALQHFRKSAPGGNGVGKVDDMPPEVLKAAAVTVTALEAELKPFRAAVQDANGRAAKQAARHALQGARRSTMSRLQTLRKDARAAVDAAPTLEERRAQIPALQQAKATIVLMRRHNHRRAKGRRAPPRGSHL